MKESRDQPAKRGLSREFVVKSVLDRLEKAERGREWGSVSITFQAGVCRLIREEKTITEEACVMK